MTIKMYYLLMSVYKSVFDKAENKNLHGFSSIFAQLLGMPNLLARIMF